MNFYSHLESIVKISPKTTAIAWESGILNFFQFHDLANNIGSALYRKFNLKKGDNIALVMENTYIFLPILFGIWKAGLTAVPINSKLHKKELSWIFQNSDTKLIFCSKEKISDIEADVPVIVNFSRDFKSLSEYNKHIAVSTNFGDSAWIFYTSGTTGKPKGAILTHQNLLFMSMAYFSDVEYIDEDDTRIHAAPMTHGSGIYSLPFILKGAKNYICQSNFDPEEIFDLINNRAKISLFAAPTMVKRLSSHPRSSSDLNGLKTLEFGGAPMYLTDTKRAIEVFGNRLYQLYGQGEAPMTITNITKKMYCKTKVPYYKELLSSAGIVRTGCSIDIIDSSWQKIPKGRIGDIVTKSDCVMKGYYNDTPATEKSLQNGWLLTGDIGSIDQYGLLTIKDRSKDMIISGGMNIYPREIEDVLLYDPSVKEVAVIGIYDYEWGEKVVAVVVLNEKVAGIEKRLDELCLKNLARFKRPREYICKDYLPKNNYGKILKTQLRKEFGNKIS